MSYLLPIPESSVTNLTANLATARQVARPFPSLTAQRIIRRGVSYMTAAISNPLPSTTYTNEAVGIKVEFNQYEVPTADYLKVFDDSGTAVSFQWEGAYNPHDVYPVSGTDPNKETDNSTYSDGSLRSGILWVMVPTLSGGATLNYQVGIYDSAQSQSFAQGIAYANVGGTSDQFTITGGIQFCFQSAQAYNLRRMYDSSNSLGGVELLTSQNGIYVTMIANGVTKHSYTAGDVQTITNARRNTTAFGYGVVFQDYETQWNWVAETGLWTRMRYRCFANGKLEVETYSWTTGALASNQRQLTTVCLSQASPSSTNIQQVNGYVENVWSSPTKWIMVADVVGVNNFEATPAGTYATQNVIAAIPIFGWANNPTAAPAGAYWSNVFRISSTNNYTNGTDANNEFLRHRNPIFTRASRYSLSESKANFISLVAQLNEQCADWITTNLHVTGTAGSLPIAWAGCGSMAILFDGYFKGIDRYTSAASMFAAWLASITNSVTSAAWTGTTADFLDGWTQSTTGIEFSGRNIQAAWYLYEDCLRTGRSTTQWVNYIHNYADFIVTAESLSGLGVYNIGNTPDGNILLKANYVDNFNAEAAAISALTRSLAITSNSTRLATLNRIIARFTSGFEAQNLLPYQMSPASGAIQSTVTNFRFHYQGFSMCDSLEAYKINPSLTAWTFQPRASVQRIISPLGYVWERLYDDNARRGAGATHIYSAASLMLNPTVTESDSEEACVLLRHLLSRSMPGNIYMWETPLDGYAYTGGIGQYMDIRMCLAAAYYLLNGN